ncbi:hypothetical protein KBI23_05915 [bacterium]|jgi:hypothetical protein|nr:hypothetical protein [bacterium]MBP9810478.1 hypothetical protein [bacterium]
MANFNKIDPNDLMFEGSDGYIAAHQNVQTVGMLVVAAAFALGYWLGAKGPSLSKQNKTWTIVGIVLVCIFAGTILGLQGGITIVFWAGIALGASFFLGNRSYKRSLTAGSEQK